MRNIFKIINTDAHRIFSSVVVLVILMGLCVVPSLYAWFNVFSNWDPYGQSATSRIRVAIADVDRGADLFGLQLEVGEQLVEGLQANKQIGWVFCESPEEALQRVYSGDCYAALVVPADFSKNIVSFMTLKFEHPTLVYYENGKKNAIAPKITGKAKTAVQETVNTTFLQTLADGATSVVSVLNANGLDAETTLQDLSKKLIDLSMELDNANAMLDSVASLADAASNLINASARLTSSMAGTVYLAADISEDVGENVTDTAESAKSAVQSLGEASALTNGTLSTFFQDIYTHTESQESLKAYLEGEYDKGVGQSLQEMQESTKVIADQLKTVPGLDGFAGEMQDLSDRLGTLNSDLRTAVDTADYSGLDRIRGTVNTLSGTLGNLTQTATDASTMLGEWINNALTRIEIAAGNINELLEAFGDALVGLTYKLSSLSNSMMNVRAGILEAKEEIKRAQAKLLELADFLDALATSEFLHDVMEVLSSGGDVLDAHLASPLKVSDEVLYPAEPYGSQMSPFYTVLALWVGALFCACLLKTGIRKADRPKKLRMTQHYIGRYGLFLSCALLQALVTVAGVLLYVQIDCAHPWYFVLAGIVSSICFVTINYVLSFTLGSAGLGASVIIMVVQVAGSGGTYPVEVLPKIFQILYPFMPFKFAMNAMREAVSGFYGTYYADNIRMMLLITLGCLVLGVIIYYPAKFLNDTLEKSKQATGVMI